MGELIKDQKVTWITAALTEAASALNLNRLTQPFSSPMPHREKNIELSMRGNVAYARNLAESLTA